jgi:O-antigen ligase
MNISSLPRLRDPVVGILAAAVLSVMVAVLVVSGQFLALLALGGLPLLMAAFLQPIFALFPMMIFVPIEGFGSLVPGSFTLPRLLGVLTFACFIGNYLIQRKKIRMDTTSKLFAWFVGWCFLSTFWAADRGEAYVILFVVFQLLVFYVMCLNLLVDPQHLRLTLFFYILGCLISSLWAMKNYNTHSFATNLERVSSVQDMNPNDFARMVGFGLLANLFLLFDANSKWLRNFTLTAFPILLAGLVLSKGRGAWLAVMAALVTIFWVVEKTPRVYLAAILVVLLSVGTLGVGLHFGYLDDSFQERLEETANGNNPTAERADIWKVGMALVRGNPILGVGLNNFHVRFNEYQHTVETDVFPGFNKDPHNVFLSVLGETGVIGFVLFMGIFWVIVQNIRKAGRSWDTAMAAAFMVFTFVSAFSGTDYIRKWFWISLVVSLLLAKRQWHARIDA